MYMVGSTSDSRYAALPHPRPFFFGFFGFFLLFLFVFFFDFLGGLIDGFEDVGFFSGLGTVIVLLLFLLFGGLGDELVVGGGLVGRGGLIVGGGEGSPPACTVTMTFCPPLQ
jgi:hypothetical protein